MSDKCDCYTARNVIRSINPQNHIQITDENKKEQTCVIHVHPSQEETTFSGSGSTGRVLFCTESARVDTHFCTN